MFLIADFVTVESVIVESIMSEAVTVDLVTVDGSTKESEIFEFKMLEFIIFEFNIPEDFTIELLDVDRIIEESVEIVESGVIIDPSISGFGFIVSVTWLEFTEAPSRSVIVNVTVLVP